MRRLPAQLLIASLVLSCVVVAVAVLSLSVLLKAGRLNAELGEQQLDTLEQTEKLEDLLFEKGYVASYMATRNRKWLDELEQRKKLTKTWLERVQQDANTPEQVELAERLRASYAAYDEARDQTVKAFQEGRTVEALAAYEKTHPAVNGVLDAAHALAQASRRELVDTLQQNKETLTTARTWLAALTLVAALMGIAFGLWSGRRIARPIYELIVQAESADPERVRLSSGDAKGDELATLSGHVTRLVERLAEQRRRLVQAEKMEAVGEIAAKLAHEILNPVAAVKAALQVEMRTRQLPEPTRTVLAEADRTLSRIDGIMARLVRFARPLEPRWQPTKVETIVESGLKAAQAALQQGEVAAKTEIAPLPPVNVDPELLAQVVTNLVVNAAQASPKGETVVVRARANPHRLVLEVTDRGHGLPKARDRLFRPYFTTREKGNGLGLAVCRNIVAEHGGTIEAGDGPDGVGARFIVTIPQQEAAWANPS